MHSLSKNLLQQPPMLARTLATAQWSQTPVSCACAWATSGRPVFHVFVGALVGLCICVFLYLCNCVFVCLCMFLFLFPLCLGNERSTGDLCLINEDFAYSNLCWHASIATTDKHTSLSECGTGKRKSRQNIEEMYIWTEDSGESAVFSRACVSDIRPSRSQNVLWHSIL